MTLTGSETAGMSVAATAGHALKKSVLELGGSDPFIVLPSADLDATVQTAVNARVQNNGQSCIAAKRFIVVEAVADEFLRRFTEAMDALVVGDPFDPATQVGPIVTEAQRSRAAGPDRGGPQPGRGGPRRHGVGRDRAGTSSPPCSRASPPTCRWRRRSSSARWPSSSGCPISTAAIEVANSTTFGLGSSVWTNDEEEQRRCIEEIEAGAVFVNAMVVSTPELPFGGIKRSGFGRELSELGLKEFTNAKTVWIT